MSYTMTQHDEVLNSDETYDAITADLLEHGQILIGWNDEHMSLMDVLLTYNPPRRGVPGRLDSGSHKLCIAVMGHGAFAFGPGGYLHPGYFAEKMGMRPSPTTEGLAEMVTEVRTRLSEQP